MPIAVGVPEIVPLDIFKFSPGGKAPLVTTHEQGHANGTAVKVAVYDTLICPAGSVPGTIIGAAKTLLLKKDRLPAVMSSKIDRRRSVHMKANLTRGLFDQQAGFIILY
jgi:hypothetical protein